MTKDQDAAREAAEEFEFIYGDYDNGITVAECVKNAFLAGISYADSRSWIAVTDEIPLRPNTGEYWLVKIARKDDGFIQYEVVDHQSFFSRGLNPYWKITHYQLITPPQNTQQ